MFGRLRALIGAAALLGPSAGLAQVQVNQTFVPQGPAPGLADTWNSGAVQAILTDPALGANTMFVGSTNGGVWRTTNGGASWTPLTDRQGSLSIASLGLDALDPSGKTLVAGIGATSNGTFPWLGANGVGPQVRGGARTGLLYSTDGGDSWSALGGTAFGGQSVVGVAAIGSTIVAATFEPKDPGASSPSSGYGLYLSTDRGSTFARISGAAGTGLPAGAVSSLVADPANPRTLYAAVSGVGTSTSPYSQTGVYQSLDAGKKWKPVFTQADAGGTITNTYQTFLRVAAGPNGSLAVGVIAPCQSVSCPGTGSGVTVSGLFWSNSISWTSIPPPQSSSGSTFPSWGYAINNINQAAVNFAVAIDPNNPGLVYVSGDEGAGGDPGPLPVYRINASAVSGTTCAPACTLITGPSNEAHSDSRAIAFNSAGQMLLGSDGGIYLQTSPQTNSGQWLQTLNNLQAGESFSVAYGANAKMLLIGRQDNGVATQSAPNSLVYGALLTADGHDVAVNDTMFPNSSVFYGVNHFGENLGIQRLVVNSQGIPVSPGVWNGVPVTCIPSCDNFISSPVDTISFALNRANPSLIALGGLGGVYVTVDSAPANASAVTLPLWSVGGPSTGNITALAYGTPNNVQALLAGVAILSSGGVPLGGELWFSPDVGNGGSQLSRLTQYAGQAPTSVVLDPNSPSAQTSPGQIRFYVADGRSLWGTQNQGTSSASLTFTSLTGNLPAGFNRPTSVEFISNNGVNALLVGGINSPLSCDSSPNGCVISSEQSPIMVADSDTNGNLSGWRPLGSGLPNTLIAQMAYNPLVDVLAIAAVGRGAFTLYDVSSYFPQATVLQFGLANNDSRPDASFLTDGTSFGGTGFSRPLSKYGTGSLTIAGNATYTGGTSIFGGALQLGDGGTSGSIVGNVAFCSDAGNPLCDPSINKVLVFNRSDTYTFDGAISGPGQVVQFGTGKTVLTAVNTYTGPTYVLGGTLSVNGSIASSPVFVESGGTLGGNGTLGPTTILGGGTLSPGNSVGTLTVNGNLIFAAASLYMVEVQGSTADRTNASGTATPAGIVGVSYLGGKLAPSYTILSAAAGLTGTFDSFVAPNLPTFISANLAYTVTDVRLKLTSGIERIAGLTQNEAAVASALDNAFNSGAGSLLALYSLAPSQIPAALDMLSGEGVSGTQETAFGAAGMFNSIMMDQGAFWRNRETVDVNGVAFAEQPLAYAGPAKSKTDPSAFKAMRTKEPPMAQPRWRAWLTGFDGTTKLDGEAGIGSATLSHNTGGLAGGLDYQFAPDLLAGFAIGGSSSNFSVRDRITGGYLEGVHFGGYVVKTWRDLYAAGAMSFSTFRNGETRSIVGVGPAETATGSFGSNLLSARVEIGWKQAFDWFAVTPFAAVQPAQLWQNGFTEANPVPAGAPDPLGLSFGSRSVISLPTFLGAQFDTRFVFRNGMALSPYARVSWVHEFKPDRTINASFVALPAAAFTVDGPRAARDAARIDAGTKLAVRPNAWLFASFDGEFSSRSQSYAGKGGARVTW
jgi:outer membrane autotransporter protein